MNKRFLVLFTKYLLDFMFYSGIAVCIGVPFLFRLAVKYFKLSDKFFISYSIIYMVAGVFAIIIIWDLRKMFRTVINGSAFVRKNVDSLKRMGACAFIIMLCMAVRLIFTVTPAALVLILVFMVAGLFSLVLSQVFDQAVAYKQENDLTI